MVGCVQDVVPISIQRHVEEIYWLFFLTQVCSEEEVGYEVNNTIYEIPPK